MRLPKILRNWEVRLLPIILFGIVAVLWQVFAPVHNYSWVGWSIFVGSMLAIFLIVLLAPLYPGNRDL